MTARGPTPHASDPSPGGPVHVLVVDDPRSLHGVLARLRRGEVPAASPDGDPTHRAAAAIARLTPREREVLALMAEGRSNAGIAAALFLSASAVAKHINSVFTKLDIPPTTHDNRRVLAVLTYLHARYPHTPLFAEDPAR